MQRLRLAVASRCLQLPLKGALRRAAEMGASGIQFDARNELRPADLSETGRRQLLHSLTEMGLAVSSLDFPTRRPLADLDQLDSRLNALRETMQLAGRLKAPVVTARIGIVPEEADSEEFRLNVQVLNDLARYGNRVGVTLAVASPRPDPLSRLVQSVTEGPLGINFDPAAIVMAGGAPADAYRSLHSLVVHVIVRDGLRDAELGVEVSLGRGEVPWDELLALFDEAGYTGWCTIDRTQGDDRPGDAARAIQYLRQLALG